MEDWGTSYGLCDFHKQDSDVVSFSQCWTPGQKQPWASTSGISLGILLHSLHLPLHVSHSVCVPVESCSVHSWGSFPHLSFLSFLFFLLCWALILCNNSPLPHFLSSSLDFFSLCLFVKSLSLSHSSLFCCHFSLNVTTTPPTQLF